MYLLLCISLILAALLAINLGASSLIGISWRVLSSRATRLSASSRSGLLFVLAVAPSVIGIVFVAAILLPAYLIHEPRDSDERVGIELAIAAAVSVIGIAAAAWRVFGSWWTTRRLIREWLRNGEEIAISGVTIPVFRVTTEFPVIAIVGAISPKMFVAARVLDELDERELAAAVAHELGHIAARDNLRRMLIRISRDLLVFPIWRSIENDWNETAETAADEFAARTSETTALDLASVLIKIARIVPPGGSANLLPTGTYLVAEDSDLISRRVRSLVSMAGSGLPAQAPSSLPALVLVGSATLLSAIVFKPDFLRAVHDLTERLVATLQ